MLDIGLLAEEHHCALPWNELEKETKLQENSDKHSEESLTLVTGSKNLWSLTTQDKQYVVLHPTDRIRNGDASKEEGLNAIFKRKRAIHKIISVLKSRLFF